MKTKISRMLGVALSLVMVLALAITFLPARAPTAEAAAGTLYFGNIPLPKFGPDGKYVMVPGISNPGPIGVSPSGATLYAGYPVTETLTYKITRATSNSTLALTITYKNQYKRTATTTLSLATGLAVNATGTVALATGDTGVFNATDVTGTGNVTAVGGFRLLSGTSSTILISYDDNNGAGQGTDTAGTALPENSLGLLKSTDKGYTWDAQSGFRSEALSESDNTSIVAIKFSPQYETDGTAFVATKKNVFQTVDGGKAFAKMSQPTEWTTTENITDMDVGLDKVGRLSVIIGSTDATAGEVYVYCPATTGMTWKAQALAGTRQVLAVAFSPNFASDEGIMAIGVNATDTKLEAAFGFTKYGGGWGSSIGPAKFLNKDGAVITNTVRARIAFPTDFDVDSISTNIAFVGLYAGTTGNELGDVYKVTLQPTLSSSADLNVRGAITAYAPTTTNIWSIAVTGNADAATILVGTDYWSTAVENYYWLSYYSTDSGKTWSTAGLKSPTGGPKGTDAAAIGAQCDVLLAPDFATSKIAYAVTNGAETAALSRSADGGKSWNQISLIDYTNASYPYYWIASLDAAPPQMYMVTSVGTGAEASTAVPYLRGALWVTNNNGANWERVVSYANPTITDRVRGMKVFRADSTIFVYDCANGYFWRSSDMGASWPRKISAYSAGIGSYPSIVDVNTIYTNVGSAIWYTTNLGRPWVAPDESAVTGTPTFFSKKGDHMVLTNTAGQVFFSADAGKVWKRLGVTDPGTAAMWPIFDSDYTNNKYFYAADMVLAGHGISRIAIDPVNPSTTEWKRIDAAEPTAAATVKPGVTIILGGVMYSWDGATVGAATTGGGLWRSVNPTGVVESLYPPKFESIITNLAAGDIIGYAAISANPTTIFAKNSRALTATNYYNQLLGFVDTLGSAPALVSPDDGATGQGIKINTTDLTMTEVLSWKSITGATKYNWQVATDKDFTTVVAFADTTNFEQGVIVNARTLIPGVTYYWRVRVEKPFVSPWATLRTFSTGSPIDFDIISPVRGATGVSVEPSLVWSKFQGAIQYHVVVSTDPTFATFERSRLVDTTFDKYPVALAYNTTYYWRVRGITGTAVGIKEAPGGAWVTGMFTTEAEPAEPTPPVTITQPSAPQIVKVEVPGPPAAIPNYLLWTIIGIGAILVIALIVLIVRTRRVT